jgi:hypothetical protein
MTRAAPTLMSQRPRSDPYNLLDLDPSFYLMETDLGLDLIYCRGIVGGTPTSVRYLHKVQQVKPLAAGLLISIATQAFLNITDRT